MIYFLKRGHFTFESDTNEKSYHEKQCVDQDRAHEPHDLAPELITNQAFALILILFFFSLILAIAVLGDAVNLFLQLSNFFLEFFDFCLVKINVELNQVSL